MRHALSCRVYVQLVYKSNDDRCILCFIEPRTLLYYVIDNLELYESYNGLPLRPFVALILL